MSDPIGNHLNSQALGVRNCLIPALAIAHYAGQFESFRDPAAIFLDIQVNRQIHSLMILL